MFEIWLPLISVFSLTLLKFCMKGRLTPLYPFLLRFTNPFWSHGIVHSCCATLRLRYEILHERCSEAACRMAQCQIRATLTLANQVWHQSIVSFGTCSKPPMWARPPFIFFRYEWLFFLMQTPKSTKSVLGIDLQSSAVWNCLILMRFHWTELIINLETLKPCTRFWVG